MFCFEVSSSRWSPYDNILFLDRTHYTVGEYKYQIGCQVDYNPNNPETPMLIMELERVVRNLPQTITGETPKAMPTRTKVRGAIPKPSMLYSGQSHVISAGGAHRPYMRITSKLLRLRCIRTPSLPRPHHLRVCRKNLPSHCERECPLYDFCLITTLLTHHGRNWRTSLLR